MEKYYIDVQDMPYLIERKGVASEVSSAFCELSYYEKSELLGRSVKELFEKSFRIKQKISDMEDQLETFMFNKLLQPHEITIQKKRIRETGEIIYVFSKKAVSVLNTQLKFLDQLYLDNHYGVAVYDSEFFTLLKANSRYLDIFKETFENCEDCIGLTLKELIEDFEGSESQKRWNRIVHTGETVYLEDFEGAVGEMKGKYWQNTIAPIKEDGKVKLVVSMLIDITDRVISQKKLEEKSRIINEQNELIENIMENLYENITVMDSYGNYIFKKNNIIKEFSKKIDSIDEFFRTVKFYYASGEEIPLNKLTSYSIKRGKYVKDRIVIVKVEGKEYYLLYSEKPIYDRDGNYLYGIGASRNITEVIKSQQALKEAQEQLLKVEREKNAILLASIHKIEFQAKLLDLSHEAVIAWEYQGDIIYWNRGAEKLYGYGREEAEEQNIQALLKTVHPCDAREILIALEKNKYWTGEIHRVTKDGRTLIIAASMQIILNDAGQKIILENNHDVTAEKKINETLQLAKDRLSVALESVDAGIWEWDISTNEQVWSPKVYEIYGIDPSEPVTMEKGISRVHPDDRQKFENSLKEAFETHSESWKLEFRIISPEQSIVWLKGTGKIVYDTSGTPVKMVGINIDITKQREYEKHLLEVEFKKNENLNNTLKIKDEFLYLITHEFKTPLAVINSALQTMDLLCKNQMPQKANKFINSIKQNTNRQLRLVNNLLDITRINAGKIKLNKGVYDIVYLVQAIVASIQSHAEQKGVKVLYATKLSKKEIFTDEEKVERILLNLLSNALKFTPKGKCIRVGLASKRYKNRNMICISVKDEGIGIPKDRQESVFERFGQANTILSRQAEGTGIGLYLVKLFVDALDGYITLESEEGKGSTFNVMLPAIKALALDEDAEAYTKNGNFYSEDSRLIQSVSIEFSDIYV